MKFSKLFFVALLAGLVSVQINAFHPDTGESVTSVDVVGCADFVKEAADKLQALYRHIQIDQRDADVAKQRSEDVYQKFIKRVEMHIKTTLKEVRDLLNKAEKKASTATMY